MSRSFLRRGFSFLAVAAVMAAVASPVFAASWSAAPHIPSTTNTGLLEIDATSSSNAWVAGFQYTGSGSTSEEKGIAWQWNGTTWTNHPPTAPPNSPKTYYFQSVSTLSSSDTWIVGQAVDGTAQSNSQGGTYTPSIPVIEHWNGKSWTIANLPPGASGSAVFMYGIDAVSPTNVWADGGYEANSATQPGPLVYHFNGSTWTTVSVPFAHAALLGITSYGSTVYIMGATATSTPLIAQSSNNGSSWNSVALPTPSGAAAIYSLDVVNAGDMWAAQSIQGSSGILHWNGSKWLTLSGYVPTIAKTVEIASVNELPNGEVLAGGAYLYTVGGSASPSSASGSNGTQYTIPFLEIYNGKTWTQVTLPGFSYGNINGIARGGSTVWAVGIATTSAFTSNMAGLESSTISGLPAATTTPGSPTPSSPTSSGGSGGWIVIIVVVVLFVAGALGLYLVQRKPVAVLTGAQDDSNDEELVEVAAAPAPAPPPAEIAPKKRSSRPSSASPPSSGTSRARTPGSSTATPRPPQGGSSGGASRSRKRPTPKSGDSSGTPPTDA